MPKQRITVVDHRRIRVVNRLLRLIETLLSAEGMDVWREDIEPALQRLPSEPPPAATRPAKVTARTVAESRVVSRIAERLAEHVRSGGPISKAQAIERLRADWPGLTDWQWLRASRVATERLGVRRVGKTSNVRFVADGGAP